MAPGTLDPLTKELVYMTEVIGPPAKRTVQYVDELCGLLPANALGRLVRGLFRPCTAASNTRRSNRLAGRSPQDQRASGKALRGGLAAAVLVHSAKPKKSKPKRRHT